MSCKCRQLNNTAMNNSEIWEAKKSNCAQLSGTLINFFNVCFFLKMFYHNLSVLNHWCFIRDTMFPLSVYMCSQLWAFYYQSVLFDCEFMSHEFVPILLPHESEL